MKKPTNEKQYFFVDESGDPYFYNRHGENILHKNGCSPILILGFIRTKKPGTIRAGLKRLKNIVAKDGYLVGISSVKNSLKAFHAKDDCPEVRERVFKAVKRMDFKCEFILARKLEDVFITRHKKRPNLFYDDMVAKLFINQLHKTKTNIICFATRSNKARALPLENAIKASIMSFEALRNTKTDVTVKVVSQSPEGEPCIQITDYMCWALQRAYVKQEDRYIESVREKISLIWDIYDFERHPKNYYNKRNKFDIQKLSPQKLVCTKAEHGVRPSIV